jgi:hypothetical protein
MWHYKPFKVVTPKGTYWSVREYYNIPNLTKYLKGRKSGVGWTGDITPRGDTKKDLIHVLELMLRDVKTRRSKTVSEKEFHA